MFPNTNIFVTIDHPSEITGDQKKYFGKMNVAQRLCLRRILNLCLEHASLKAWDYEAKGNKWTTFFAKIQIEREGGVR